MRYALVQCTPNKLAACVGLMRPLRITSDILTGSLSQGGVTFQATCKTPIFLHWNWVEISADVFAIYNQLEIDSNIQLVTDSAVILPSTEYSLHLNSFIYRLPWQAAIARHKAAKLNRQLKSLRNVKKDD